MDQKMKTRNSEKRATSLDMAFRITGTFGLILGMLALIIGVTAVFSGWVAYPAAAMTGMAGIGMMILGGVLVLS